MNRTRNLEKIINHYNSIYNNKRIIINCADGGNDATTCGQEWDLSGREYSPDKN